MQQYNKMLPHISLPKRSIEVNPNIENEIRQLIDATRNIQDNQDNVHLADVLGIIILIFSILNKLSLENKFKRKPIAVLNDEDINAVNEIQNIMAQMAGVFECDRVVFALFHPSQKNGLDTEMSLFRQFVMPGVAPLEIENVNVEKVQVEIFSASTDEFIFLKRSNIDNEACLRYLDTIGLHGAIYRRIVGYSNVKVGILELHNLNHSFDSESKNVLKDKNKLILIERIYSSFVSKIKKFITSKEGVTDLIKDIVVI